MPVETPMHRPTPLLRIAAVHTNHFFVCAQNRAHLFRRQLVVSEFVPVHTRVFEPTQSFPKQRRRPFRVVVFFLLHHAVFVVFPAAPVVAARVAIVTRALDFDGIELVDDAGGLGELVVDANFDEVVFGEFDDFDLVDVFVGGAPGFEPVEERLALRLAVNEDDLEEVVEAASVGGDGVEIGFFVGG
ncbi:hypothetical protein MHBO_003173 [Bonamia ostreae]|uniref:Uncharacterized protein n=1 Tax=Bonamia ostreae TaxID=126728 RepID=A0ABV2APN8_9EUKA